MLYCFFGCEDREEIGDTTKGDADTGVETLNDERSTLGSDVTGVDTAVTTAAPTDEGV